MVDIDFMFREERVSIILLRYDTDTSLYWIYSSDMRVQCISFLLTSADRAAFRLRML